MGLTGPIGAGCTTLGKIIMRTSLSSQVKRKGLYEEVIRDLEQTSEEMKKENEETKLKGLNEKLGELYKQRSYLRVLKQIIDPKFVYISMSALIVKLALENIDTPEFLNWSVEFPELSDKLREFHSKWHETIDIYNSNSKKFKELSEDDLKEIDLMFKNLNEVRELITSMELGDFFSKETNELHLQIFGDNLRKTGNAFSREDFMSNYENLSIIAKEVNKYIKYIRNRKDSKNANCFIIDAFRNPAEVEFFRRYDQFFLISLFATEETRCSRMMRTIFESSLNAPEDFPNLFKRIDERDWGDDSNIRELYKQNVSRCYYMSDISINNDEDTPEFNIKLFKRFLRYFALIASPGCIQPTKEETFMNLAYSLSLRSSCISRKVGAVVTDKAGFVLGLGWNEVAQTQVGCGLKQKQDLINNTEFFSADIFKEIITKDDLSQYSEHDAVCFKDVVSENKIKSKLKKSSLTKEEQAALLKIINVKRLEFCRALHAEENAILQVATRGGMGVEGGVIYTTTFPCELCAKKIY